jgi:hypothetical protein
MRNECRVEIGLENAAARRGLLHFRDNGRTGVPQRIRKRPGLHLPFVGLSFENSRARVEVRYFMPLVFNDFGQYAGWGANGHRGTLVDFSS